MQTRDRGDRPLRLKARPSHTARFLIASALSALALALFPALAGAIGLAPIVSIKPAVQVTGGFELKGTIAPYGLDTTYHFEYGTTTAYGSNVPVPDGDAGASSDIVTVSQTVTGLTPSTTYHYRLLATNSAGPGAPSSDETFTTPANANTPPPPSNQFTVGSATTKGANATVAVTVPGAGTISASGKDLKAASASATGAGRSSSS